LDCRTAFEPSREAEAKEGHAVLQRQLRMAISALSRRQQLVLHLKYGKALSVREIAQKLKLTKSTVSREHKIALAKLGRRLSQFAEIVELVFGRYLTHHSLLATNQCRESIARCY
jgi:DNA-directed RNA polymerase specialized sigma subunit